MSKYVLGDRAAAAVRRLMEGQSSVYAQPTRTSGTLDVQEYALPWAVEWAQSESSGDGAWIIWLPSDAFKAASNAVLDAAFATLRTGLDDADNHSGWKILPVSTSSTATVYLRIVESGSSAYMSFGTSSSPGALNIAVANITRNTSDQDHPPVKVKQMLVGALVLGGEAADSVPGCFEIAISAPAQSGDSYSMTFSNQYYNVGGKSFSASVGTVTSSDGSGIVALRIDATGSSPSVTIQVYADFPALQYAQENRDYFIAPLYTIAQGVVTCDWRKGPNAAMWEF